MTRTVGIPAYSRLKALAVNGRSRPSRRRRSYASLIGVNSHRLKASQRELEGHSVERIYLRQRSFDGAVNKTILKPRLARTLAAVGFSRRKIPCAKFRSLHDIRESNPVPASGL